jgi:hypothetical protein
MGVDTLSQQSSYTILILRQQPCFPCMYVCATGRIGVIVGQDLCRELHVIIQCVFATVRCNRMLTMICLQIVSAALPKLLLRNNS